MTKIEALRAELKCREMVEGTGLDWEKVVRMRGCTVFNGYAPFFDHPDASQYELALGIIEGKPVWAGDKLFFPSGDQIVVSEGVRLSEATGGLYDLSWNPPAPKTVMVKLTVDSIDVLLSETSPTGQQIIAFDDIRKACRKVWRP